MATWYWDGNIDSNWANTSNWWSAPAPTGFPNPLRTHPSVAPWTTSPTKDDNLAIANSPSNSPQNFSSTIGDPSHVWSITGTCSIDGFSNGWNIYDGTFTGNSCGNSGDIYGGTFSGSNFVNIGNIHGGTFSGSNLTNDGEITGGNFGPGCITASVSNGNVYLNFFNGTVFQKVPKLDIIGGGLA